MTSPQASEVPAFHDTLESFADTVKEMLSATDSRGTTNYTHEFAMTSTYCPGTKCMAEKVVPITISSNHSDFHSK